MTNSLADEAVVWILRTMPYVSSPGQPNSCAATAVIQLTLYNISLSWCYPREFFLLLSANNATTLIEYCPDLFAILLHQGIEDRCIMKKTGRHFPKWLHSFIIKGALQAHASIRFCRLPHFLVQRPCALDSLSGKDGWEHTHSTFPLVEPVEFLASRAHEWPKSIYWYSYSRLSDFYWTERIKFWSWKVYVQEKGASVSHAVQCWVWQIH